MEPQMKHVTTATPDTTEVHLERARKNLARAAEAAAEVEKILKGRA